MEFIFVSTNWRTLREHPIEPVLVDDWLNRARHCRVSSRNNSSPDTRLNDIGLRLVLQ